MFEFASFSAKPSKASEKMVNKSFFGSVHVTIRALSQDKGNTRKMDQINPLFVLTTGINLNVSFDSFCRPSDLT